MDTNKGGFSIKVTVCLYSWDRNLLQREVTVEGLSHETTVKELKWKVCNIASKERIVEFDPDNTYLEWESIPLWDYITLGSLPSINNAYLVPHILEDSDVELVEEIYWLKKCTQVREQVQGKDEEEEEEEVNNDDDNNNNCSYRGEKRPKIKGGRLPFAQFGGLQYDGHLQFNNYRNGVPGVSKIETVDYSFYTNASVVLLAPNDCIFETLNKSLPTTSKSQYLIVRVSWDVLSYVFLRRLTRRHPEVPFVGVTDLDPNHLDLLTFLDTPPLSVTNCYDWLLGNGDDDDDQFYIHEEEFADIAWLGLRPSQWLACPPSAAPDFCIDEALPSDFCKVIRMLEVNPYLRCKEGWLEELECLKRVGKTVLLEELVDVDDFITQKLSQKDWIPKN